MAFQMREQNDADFHKVCFFLLDKHLFTTSCQEHVLDMINKYKGNSKGNKKCFSDMILWYIKVCKFLLSVVFEVQKRTQP